MNISVDDKIRNGFNYPIYPNVAHGDTMYKDIRQYLISRKNSAYISDYPNYIINSKDPENQKRYFRNRAKNFTLNDNNELMMKYLNKKKKGNNINNYKLYKVPLTSNIYEWIKKIHYDLDHRSFHYVKYKILQDKYYYKGIYNELKNVIKNCEICSMKHGNVMKREPTSQIIYSILNKDMLEI